jgi:hypothetical protein
LLRQHRYPLLSRAHGGGVRCLHRVSLQRFHNLTPRFPPPGLRGSDSPASSVLSGRCDFPPSIPPRFVFLRLAVPRVAPAFVSSRHAGAARGTRSFGLRQPRAAFTRKRRDLPRSWVTSRAYALLYDPGRTRRTRSLTVRSRGPRGDHGEGSCIADFEAQSHGLDTRCLRFAVWITPPHARLASGCGPGSAGRDLHPSGHDERFQSVTSWHCILLSQAPWRKVTHDCLLIAPGRSPTTSDLRQVHGAGFPDFFVGGLRWSSRNCSLHPACQQECPRSTHRNKLSSLWRNSCADGDLQRRASTAALGARSLRTRRRAG